MSKSNLEHRQDQLLLKIAETGRMEERRDIEMERVRRLESDLKEAKAVEGRREDDVKRLENEVHCALVQYKLEQRGEKL